MKRLQGEPTLLRDKPAFIPATSLYLIGIAIVIVFIFRFRKLYDEVQESKKKKKRELSRQATLNRLGSQVQMPSGGGLIRFNNLPVNPEVTSGPIIFIMAFFSLAALIATYFMYYSPSSSGWSEFEYFLIADFSLPIILCLIHPIILYSRNEKLRRFIKEDIFYM